MAYPQDSPFVSLVKVVDGAGNERALNVDANGKIAVLSEVTEADGANETLGATTDAAVDTDTTGTVSGKLRGMVKLFVNFLSRLPAALGAGGGLKVDGSGTALPVSGTFWQTTQPVSGTVTVDGTVTANQGAAHATLPWKVEGVAGGEPVATSASWRAALQADETADDSDKTFTVPASTEWQPMSIWIELTTTAAVGDRQLEVQLQDSAGDVIAQVQAGVVQAASLTRNYLFALGAGEAFGFVDTAFLKTPLPMLVLPAGFKVRVWDNNAVAAAADDMIVQMMVNARAV